jgi:hypothetical protein
LPKTPGSINSNPAAQCSPFDLQPTPGVLQQSLEPTWAPLQPMPESLILGDANETLNSFAHLAALRLNMDRVFIR